MAKKKTKSHSKTRHLIRPKKGKILGGVCAAVANYFDIKPTFVRIGFIILVILTGPLMLLPYFLGWVLIPAQK